MAAKKTGKALVRWDEELAKQAELSAAMEANSGGGQFFSLKSGVLSWQDAPMKDNQMAVIILDSILENVFYEGRFDAQNPVAPTCFAFGRDEPKMQPHKLVFEAHNEQHQLCAGCPQNEFGTAEVGRGKACKNTRRLAMILAGTFGPAGKFEAITEEEHFDTTTIGYMKLPVTSVKGYGGFVKQVAGALRRPPHGMITKVRVVPDGKDQFKVLFEPLSNVPDELMGVVMKRHEEAAAAIDFPYQPNEDKPAPVRGRGGRNAERDSNPPGRPGVAPAKRTARKY